MSHIIAIADANESSATLDEQAIFVAYHRRTLKPHYVGALHYVLG